MADKKISALTAASTPLVGTEVLPIVQSGATVKVAVSDLTAGRAISATQLTLTAGNLIPANGYGIDFSATPGTGTSELLADYEEGTWTPTSVAGTATSAYGIYTKIGRQITVVGALTFPVQIDASIATVGGLPFTSNSIASGGVVIYTTLGTSLFLFGTGGGTTFSCYTTAGGPLTYTAMSGIRLDFTMTYLG
jgi:hypothetical protein